jgi:hypothetical protein
VLGAMSKLYGNVKISDEFEDGKRLHIPHFRPFILLFCHCLPLIFRSFLFPESREGNHSDMGGEAHGWKGK